LKENKKVRVTELADWLWFIQI